MGWFAIFVGNKNCLQKKTPVAIMKKLTIYEYQAKQIEDTLRLVANTLKSHPKTTSLDRDVMQSWAMIKNVLNDKIDERVIR